MQLKAIQDKKLIMSKQVQLQAKGREGLTHSHKVDFTQSGGLGVGLDNWSLCGILSPRVGERDAVEEHTPF